jgi:hypothetical protein
MKIKTGSRHAWRLDAKDCRLQYFTAKLMVQCRNLALIISQKNGRTDEERHQELIDVYWSQYCIARTIGTREVKKPRL